MSERRLRLVVSSMELARVREIETSEPGNVRFFKIGNDGQETESDVVYWCDPIDMIYCGHHRAWDDCSCSARLRLCGALTNSVTPNVLNRAGC